MDIQLQGDTVRLYHGGRTFDKDLPAILLLHGAGHDHSVWTFQARHLAQRGFTIIAPDLPAHGRSGGAQLASIEALANWTLALADALGLARIRLAGHSMGSLIALAAAAAAPRRVAALALLGSVAPMSVAPALLEAAKEDRARAHDMINQWSYTPRGQLGASPTPGSWLTGANRSLMERQAPGVLATDLAACTAWQDGLAAAGGVVCPTLLICGERDQMTPPRAVKPLRDALVNAQGGARMMEIPGAGHALMAETPDAISDALRGFFTDT